MNLWDWVKAARQSNQESLTMEEGGYKVWGRHTEPPAPSEFLQIPNVLAQWSAHGLFCLSYKLRNIFTPLESYKYKNKEYAIETHVTQSLKYFLSVPV